ncbi:MAG TPA: hypothetical protein VFB45_10355 [Pseudolabrys sp.]|nr:hypothetical protein [Pseudolabrys sp.]
MVARRSFIVTITAVAVLGAAAPVEAAPKKPPECAWGRTAAHTCVDPKLAQDVQRAGLVSAQPYVNRDFSPYLPPNREVQNMYPLFSNQWWSVRINTPPP